MRCDLPPRYRGSCCHLHAPGQNSPFVPRGNPNPSCPLPAGHHYRHPYAAVVLRAIGDRPAHGWLQLRQAPLPSVGGRASLPSGDSSCGSSARMRLRCRWAPPLWVLPMPAGDASVGADPLRAGRPCWQPWLQPIALAGGLAMAVHPLSSLPSL
ncbi:hypothetical protein BHM03_00047714 [Ensete ventricosum]|nr:hypothetical protein BHM03_00047714 [Ensete ventricosum]